jgi:hypothetical protein
MRRSAIWVAAAACVCAPPLAAIAAKPPKPKKGKTSLTAVAKPPVVTYGGTATLSGVLKGPNHANRPVALQRNPFPFAGFKYVAVTRTDSKGAYRFTLRPHRHTRYRTVTPQPVTIYDEVIASPEVLEHVRLRVSIRLSDSTPRRGRRVRFSGFVAPKHNGRPVFIQRRRRDHRWVTIARTVTRDAKGNVSKYSRRVRIFRTALYRVRVRGHADHSTGTSRVRSVRVH